MVMYIYILHRAITNITDKNILLGLRQFVESELSDPNDINSMAPRKC